MRTIKRSTPEIDTSIDNYSKYLNQMTFKGILEDDNIYTVDQESFRDAQNVYVNSEQRLVSRPTLQRDNIPDGVIPLTYTLIDVINVSIGTVYISQSSDENNLITVVFNNGETSYSIQGISNYHISIIEHYIICFNNLGAKVIDGNNIGAGWQDFNDFVEIPIIKRVVGNTETTYPVNNFTDAYKEQYIWSNESNPIIPDNLSSGEVEVFSPEGNYKYPITFADENTDYKIVRPIKLTEEQHLAAGLGNMTVEKDIICIGYADRFDISSTKLNSYTTVYYPGNIDDPIRRATLSKNGEYVFVIDKSGVYRCNLGDYTWSKPFTLPNNEKILGSVDRHSVCFMTGDIFCFIGLLNSDESPSRTRSMRLYFKGPGLYTGNNYEQGNNVFSYTDNIYTNWQNAADGYLHTNNLLDLICSPVAGVTSINTSGLNINMSLITGINGEEATAIVICGDATSDRTTAQSRIVTIIGGNNPFATVDMGYMFANEDLINAASAPYKNVVGFELTQIFGTPTNWSTNVEYEFVIGVSLTGLGNLETTVGNAHWREINYSVFIYKNTDNTTYLVGEFGRHTSILPELPNDYTDLGEGVYLPKKLDGGYIQVTATSVTGYLPVYVYSNISKQWSSISDEFEPEISIADNMNIFTTGDKFYIDGLLGTLLTNDFRDSDSATITFTTNATSKFTKVPTISYSDTELYLAFDNLLQITNNARDGVNILFNLPKINDQSFIDSITAMINISTTEVALFFLDKVVICSKREDTNLDQGFRYDYYNTKLSTGVRLGDSVINTLEGSYTVFPTRRGLAIMNYQAFMATTDQVIQYITDGVQKMWDSFFNNSKQIKIIQWRNKLVLTNNTKTLLLYDLTDAAWWRWELPENVLKTLTDQISLQTVNNTLCIFKDATQYYDFSEIGDFREINWYIQSQPLHMNAPNYYKNLKQIVFQMFSDKDTIEKQSLMVQIKLYRKRITIRDPETIEFKIDNLRTFVKRFNYWKINEVQWGLGNDTTTNTPAKLEFNGITIKYELGEEVR